MPTLSLDDVVELERHEQVMLDMQYSLNPNNILIFARLEVFFHPKPTSFLIKASGFHFCENLPICRCVMMEFESLMARQFLLCQLNHKELIVLTSFMRFDMPKEPSLISYANLTQILTPPCLVHLLYHLYFVSSSFYLA